MGDEQRLGKHGSRPQENDPMRVIADWLAINNWPVVLAYVFDSVQRNVPVAVEIGRQASIASGR